MKKLLIFVAMFFAATSLSAQVQTEFEYGVSDRDFLNVGAVVAYDFECFPFTAGFRYGKEKGINGYSIYNPTHYASLFARAYSGKGLFRIGMELDLELCQRYSSYSYSGYDNRRTVCFRPCIACFPNECFGVSLNPFRYIWWSGTDSDLLCPEELKFDFRTVSVSVIYKFAFQWR